jgi:outer membrane lipoprotein-sorting protein
MIQAIVRAVLILLIFPLPPAAAEETDTYPVALHRMKERFDALNDYQCSFDSFVTDARRTQKWTYRYFFKKPDLIRMEIVAGDNKGAILIVRDGKVRAKPAGLLSILTLTLKPDDPKVIDVRKNRPDQTSWDYYLDQHLLTLDRAVVLSSGRETLDGRSVLVYEIASRDPARTQGIAREKLWVAVPDDLPVRYEMFDAAGRLVLMAHFKDILLDQNLPDSLFKDFKR